MKLSRSQLSAFRASQGLAGYSPFEGMMGLCAVQDLEGVNNLSAEVIMIDIVAN
jgi:hypothetical protein